MQFLNNFLVVAATLFVAATFAGDSPIPMEKIYKDYLPKLKGYVTGSNKEAFDKAVGHAEADAFYQMLKKLKSPIALKAFKEIFSDPAKYIIMKEGKKIDEDIVNGFKTVHKTEDKELETLISHGPYQLISVKEFCDKKKDDIKECKTDELAEDMLIALDKALKENTAELTEDEKKLSAKFLEECDIESNMVFYVGVAIAIVVVLAGIGIALYFVLGRK